MQYVDLCMDLHEDGSTWTVTATTDRGAHRPVAVPDGEARFNRLTAAFAVREERVADLAAELGAFLFPGPVLDLVRRTYATLGPGRGLRLRLVHRTRRTAELPWEMLRVDLDHERSWPYLTTLENVSMVRQHESERTSVTEAPAGLLRAVLAFAPRAPGYAVLALPQQGRADAWFAGMQRAWLEHATYDQLADALSGGADLVEFSGHCTDVPGDGPCVIFETRGEGPARAVPAAEYADLLVGAGVWLAVVNACGSARQKLDGPTRSVVEVLLAAGVGVVVGMQRDVDDAHALRFTEAVYPALVHAGVEEAVSLGRRNIHALGLLPEYGNPVLYCGGRGDLGESAPADGLDPLRLRLAAETRLHTHDAGVRLAFISRLVTESTPAYRTNLFEAALAESLARPEPAPPLEDLMAALVAAGPAEALLDRTTDAELDAISLIVLRPEVWPSVPARVRSRLSRDLTARSSSPERDGVLEAAFERLLVLQRAELLTGEEVELVELVGKQAPLGIDAPDQLPLAVLAQRLLVELGSANALRRDSAVQVLLHHPTLEFDDDTEAELGSRVLQQALALGASAKTWPAMAELLTVPFLRHWPLPRLVGALSAELVSDDRLTGSIGPAGRRIVAAASLTGRLESLVSGVRPHVAVALPRSAPGSLAALADALGGLRFWVRDEDDDLGALVRLLRSPAGPAGEAGTS